MVVGVFTILMLAANLIEFTMLTFSFFFFLNSIACHTEAPLRASKSCSSCHPKCFEGCVFRVQCQGYRMYEFVYQSLRNC
jgi:hypothetical protein